MALFFFNGGCEKVNKLILNLSFIKKMGFSEPGFRLENNVSPYVAEFIWLFSNDYMDMIQQFFPWNDDVSSRQPETKAIMKWLKEIHFTASASLHGVIYLLIFCTVVLKLCRSVFFIFASFFS